MIDISFSGIYPIVSSNWFKGNKKGSNMFRNQGSVHEDYALGIPSITYTKSKIGTSNLMRPSTAYTKSKIETKY